MLSVFNTVQPRQNGFYLQTTFSSTFSDTCTKSRQAIICINDGLVYWRIYTTLRLDELAPLSTQEVLMEMSSVNEELSQGVNNGVHLTLVPVYIVYVHSFPKS